LEHTVQLYTPAEHHSVSRHRRATHYDLEAVVGLSYRAMTLWLLGYPDAALLDVDRALNVAREFRLALSLLLSLAITGLIRILGGNDAAAHARADELIAVAQEKGTAAMWQAVGLAD
jgi:hypothetical protein